MKTALKRIKIIQSNSTCKIYNNLSKGFIVGEKIVLFVYTTQQKKRKE